MEGDHHELLVKEFHGKSGRISTITCTVSNELNSASPCNGFCQLMAFIRTTELFFVASIALSAIQRSTDALEY